MTGIVVWTPDRKQHRGTTLDVTGLTDYVVGSGQEQGTINGMIVPYQVEAWIRAHILGQTVDQEAYEAKQMRHLRTVTATIIPGMDFRDDLVR
jgi:hypothetical protein